MNEMVLPKGEGSTKILAFSGTNWDIKRFLNVDAPELGKSERAKYISLSNKTKRTLLEVLKDRWMLYQLGNDSIYVTHVYAGRQDVLYQIILSGQEWDGIYEFALKGKKIVAEGYIIDGKNTLVIESQGNYNLATFGQGDDNIYTICRADYKTDKDFVEAMIATGLVSREDMEIYYKPDDIIKPYLNKVLPRVIFQ
jgi:hypothetical protein